jgi:hypothetical protein
MGSAAYIANSNPNAYNTATEKVVFIYMVSHTCTASLEILSSIRSRDVRPIGLCYAGFCFGL